MEFDFAALIQPTPIDQVVAACRLSELYHHVLVANLVANMGLWGIAGYVDSFLLQ